MDDGITTGEDKSNAEISASPTLGDSKMADFVAHKVLLNMEFG